MKNKALMLAGLGLGSALTLTAFSLASANEATTTSTTTPATQPAMMGERGERGGMGMMMKKGGQKNEAAEQALANNDYNAFLAATQPTQEEFAEMVAHYKSRQAAEAAIKANDYAAFQTATKGTPMEGKVTQEQFTKMVNRHANTNK